MSRMIEIALAKRGVACTARLLDELAPRTCEAVWSALPQGGEVYHAKYARNEIYTLVDGFSGAAGLGYENTTITPIPGDVVLFAFAPWQLAASSHGYSPAGGEQPGHDGVTVDLAVFYARNNLLLNPDFGFVPGNVFATIESGLARFADAAQDLWRNGAIGEALSFRRLPDK